MCIQQQNLWKLLPWGGKKRATFMANATILVSVRHFFRITCWSWMAKNMRVRQIVKDSGHTESDSSLWKCDFQLPQIVSISLSPLDSPNNFMRAFWSYSPVLQGRRYNNNLNLSELWSASPALAPEPRISSFHILFLVLTTAQHIGCSQPSVTDEKLKQREVGKQQHYNSWAQFQQAKAYFGVLAPETFPLGMLGDRHFYCRKWSFLVWVAEIAVDVGIWQGYRVSGSGVFYLLLWSPERTFPCDWSQK